MVSVGVILVINRNVRVETSLLLLSLHFRFDADI
jgi:hypothetical protein